MFDLEKKRQRDAVGRIEKIEIRYLGLPEDTTLIMNKNLSTPFNCAQRKTIIDIYFFIVIIYLYNGFLPFEDLSDIHCKRSVVALIDGNIPWDMHRPFENSCTLQLLNFTVAEPYVANRYELNLKHQSKQYNDFMGLSFQHILAIVFIHARRCIVKSIQKFS